MKKNEQPSLLDRIAAVSGTLTGQQMVLARFI